jgi:hypothetical protein
MNEEGDNIDKTLFDFDDDIDKLSDVEDRWQPFNHHQQAYYKKEETKELVDE